MNVRRFGLTFRSARGRRHDRVDRHSEGLRDPAQGPSAAPGSPGQRLIDSANVAVNRPAVEAGLPFLEAGGDFADGVIAYEGNWLGAEVFISFDKRAMELAEAQGHAVRLLA